MGSSTPNSALRYPASGDAPNVPQDMQNLASDLDAKVFPQFASASVRDSTITAPIVGQGCIVAGGLQVYRAGAWRIYSEGTTQIGAVSLGPQSAGSSTFPVTFPVTFPSTPVVMVAGVPNSGVMVTAETLGITQVGFTVRVTLAAAVASGTKVNWFAIST
jgi:hypothetical protein